MKFNKIVFYIGLLVVANCSVVVAAEVDPLQAQIRLNRALCWGPNGCVVGVSEALNDGADPDKNFRNRLPLVFAARNGLEEMVRVLLEYNANVNKHNIRGCTPLYAAANRECKHLTSEGIEKQEAIMQLLIDHGAGPNVQDRYRRRPLHAVIPRWGSKGLGAVKLLLAAGADVNASYATESVIRWSSMSKEEFAEKVENSSCITALSLAAQSKCEDIVEALLTVGADPGLIPSATTCAFVKPIENKVEKAQRACVQTLLALGFNFSNSKKENVRKMPPILSGSNKSLPCDVLDIIVDLVTYDKSKRLRIEHNAAQNKN